MKNYFIGAIVLTQLLLFVSCSSSDNDGFRLDSTSVALNAKAVGSNNQHQISSNGSNLQYSSDDKYVATVSSAGLIESVCCGETTIHVTSEEGTADVAVKVQPKYQTYIEPSVDWSRTYSSMKSELGTSWIESSDENYNILTNISYDSKGDYCVYEFDKSTQKLVCSWILVPTSYMDQAVYFVAERYLIQDIKKDYDALFIDNIDANKVKTLIALAAISDSYYGVAYISKAYANTASNLSVTGKASLLQSSMKKIVEHAFVK